ncbi:MAG: transposase, partial [Alphaproteobacteria bacterium]|nr:transposase [Alphaproteobacteria bacterium]
RKQAHLQSGRVCQRLLLIANLLDGMEVDEAARLVGLGCGAAYRWHNRYEEEGIDGLHDRFRASRKCRVSAEIGQEIYDRMCAGADLDRDGVVTFRGLDVKQWLEKDYDIKLQKTAVYELIHRLKLSWLVPRPRHWLADAQAQAEFLKPLDCN